MIGIVILMVVPVILYLLFPHYNIFPFVFVFFWCLFYIEKGLNKIKVKKDKLVINNFFHKKEISYTDIKKIVVTKETFLPVETIRLRIIRNTSKDIIVHLGILPYKENVDLLIILLRHHVEYCIVL